MGAFKMLSGGRSYVGAPARYDPNPLRFTVLSTEEIGNFTIAKIRYPDCLKVDQDKILVFHGTIAQELHHLKKLDPHFSQSEHSLCARFRSDDFGMALAQEFCKAIAYGR